MAKVSGGPTKKPEAKPKKRAREEDDDSDRDSFIAYSDEDDDRKSDAFDFRAEIRAMFSRNRPSRVVDEDDSDMEATGFEMEREEARAARLARMEDEAEERRLEEHAREKKKRKLETGKKRL
jgi:protein SPT2